MKIFKLPTPTQLGKSDNDCLQSSAIDELLGVEIKEGAYTWEDYEKDIKQKFPVRYFINKLSQNSFSILKAPFENLYYYIKYNFIHRYHILDLRQESDCDCDDYRYGYSDVRERMLFAVFNLISEFVQKEIHPIENKISALKRQLDSKTLSDWEEESIKYWINYYCDVRKVYQWWHYCRKFKFSQKHSLYEVYRETKKESDKKAWLDAESEFEKEEQEMFMKACSLREGLWT